MSDFGASWNLSRQRFVDEIAGLNDQQLSWKIHDRILSIGEMAIHVAGVEMSFTSQLLGSQLTDEQSRIKAAATDGVVNELPFPYSGEEVTANNVWNSLNISKDALQPLIENPPESVLAKEIKSALGPIITGRGAFQRLAFHSAYHQGQAYLMKTHPSFPS